MACKDIIIYINQFNAEDTYAVMIKRVDNVVTDGSAIPSYVKNNATQETLFKGLPEGIYQAGIQRACAAGGVSDWSWREVVGHDCAAPADLAIGAITGVAATATWTDEPAYTFITQLDDGPPLPPTAAGTKSYTGLVAGHVYEFSVRKQCKVSEYSASARRAFATAMGSPNFLVRVVRKLCTGTTFDGYLVRFSLAGGFAAIGMKYQVSFTEFDGTTHILFEHTVTASDTEMTIAQAISNNFHGHNLLGYNMGFASFDIISKEQKVPNGVVPNCPDIDLTTGYSVAIV